MNKEERRKKVSEAARESIKRETIERGTISCKLEKQEITEILDLSTKYKVPAGILVKLLALHSLPLLREEKIAVESHIDEDLILHAKIVKNNDKKDQFFKELNEGYVNYYDI